MQETQHMQHCQNQSKLGTTQKLSQQCSDAGVALNKLAIVFTQAQKLLQLNKQCGLRPRLDHINLGLLYMHTQHINNVPKKFYTT